MSASLDTGTMLTLSVLLIALIAGSINSQLTRPRGVSLSKRVLYNPDTEFTCLDGSATLPFLYVNDDYCDCTDGSDEPGTSACPNGVFHCPNIGHKPLNIPSSRVNDAICDCCDGSDEYNSSAKCENSCRELGQAAREEAQRRHQQLTVGYQLKQEMSTKGKQLREETNKKFDEVKARKEEADEALKVLEDKKKAAEELKKAAIDKFKAAEEEKKSEAEAANVIEQNIAEAVEAFKSLDRNSDGKLSIDEIQEKWVFDSDRNGIVSEEEAKFYLNNQDEMTEEDFVAIGWPVVKPQFSLQKLFKPPEPEEAYPPVDPQLAPDGSVIPEGSATPETEEVATPPTIEEASEDEEEDDDEYNVNEDDLLDPNAPDPDAPADTTEPEPEYDEETKLLIEDYEAALKEYNEAKNNVRSLDQELQSLRTTIDIDFGPNEEFATLKGECLEYEDREYIYQLCLFDRAVQKPKSGGGETSLGRWGDWTGPEDDQFSKMKYEHGQSCWNGPSRSVEVRLICSPETKISAVAEPNRCEYTMDLHTPAACTKPPSQHDESTDHSIHEEL